MKASIVRFAGAGMYLTGRWRRRRRIEPDATRRSIDSYRRILDKLAEGYPELDLVRFTKHDLRGFLKRWKGRMASTRSNIVSELHSFFGWLSLRT